MKRGALAGTQHIRQQTDSHVVLVGVYLNVIVWPLVVIAVAVRPDLVKVYKLGAVEGERIPH